MNETTWKELQDISLREKRREKLKPLTKNQGVYLEAMRQSLVTICLGCAGVGKTWMACGFAAQMLLEGKVKKIILSRPLVTCGRGTGFLPGDLDEKVAPYMRPLLEAFGDFFSTAELEKYVRTKVIEMWPLDLMRGASVKEAIIIFDEAQNAEGLHQLHMLLTRPDKGTRLIITGDNTRTQRDIHHNGLNPLEEIVRRFQTNCHKDISIVRLTREDIIRNGFIQWVDERLTAPLEEAEAGMERIDIVCPSCQAKLFYPDKDDFIDQVECCACGAVIEPWDEQGCLNERLAEETDSPARTYR